VSRARPVKRCAVTRQNTPAVRGAVRSGADRLMAAAASGVAALALVGAVAEIPLRQAIVAVAQDDRTAAEDSFAAAGALRWWDPAVAARAGHAYAAAGTATGHAELLDRARRWLTAAGPEDRAPVPVLADLAGVLEAGGDLDNAAAVLDRALTRDPANPDLLLLRGVVAARQEQWSSAEELFESAARSAPDSPAPWENLVRVYELTGDADAATAAARRADGLRE
jgi:tetratricopeptide (TPR) repeat protein